MITQDEKLTDEQLEFVSGGSLWELNIDKSFFSKLGYNMDKTSVENAFASVGIEFCAKNGNNDYKILTSDGEFTRHPHWAALGLVLKRKNYPGFNGNWTDSNYVHSFLKDNFDLTDLG